MNTTTETTRLMLSVTYTNGNTLKELVNYAHIEGGKLQYTRDRQVYESFLDPSEISLENIASFDLFPVICHGWEPIGEEKPGFYKANGERI